MSTTVRANSQQATDVLRRIGMAIAGMNGYLFFLIIFLYHVLVTFQGLDFNDEGFHVAFYQQIFDDPESVKFGFWMWLTGIIGGGFMKLFPFLGLWGIRLAGAIVTTSTIVVSYNVLKKYLNIAYLRVSMVLLSLFINGDAKTLYYNNLSAFFYFLVAYFLFRALKEDNKRMMVFAGFFVGVNIFTRIPNVLGIGLAVSIFYYGYIAKNSFAKQFGQLALFAAGVIVSMLGIFALMKAVGHFTFFIDSIKTIMSSSQEAKKADGIGGAYGILRLLTRNLGEYVRALRSVFLIAGMIVLVGVVNAMATRRGIIGKRMALVFNIGVLVAILVFVFRGWFDDYRLMLLFTGIGMTAGLQLFNKSRGSDYKLLAWLGLLILLIHPFGSSEGLHTVGVYSLWVCFPLAVDAIAATRYMHFDVKMIIPGGRFSVKADVGRVQMRIIRISALSLVSLACAYNVVRYPYLCDQHNRLDMTTAVNNERMRGILTSGARAAALDNLLEAGRSYIKPGDYVLAYDCMPMYHFMTATKSYVRNPCIWFYSNSLFRAELDYAEKHHGFLPVVVRQNILTTGDGSTWPEIVPAKPYSQLERNLGKNAYLGIFLQRHKYRQVWTNGLFSILIPPGGVVGKPTVDAEIGH